MQALYIKSAIVCCPKNEALASFNLRSYDIDKNLIPANMRRRTSLTTRMAVTAASLACVEAQVSAQKMTSIFASLGGEIHVTDALCRLLPDEDALLSPTQFHNSVHNTTAGYWAILSQCQAPTTAIAAADDTFAMGVIEAWAQLQQQGNGECLLVCYDELWPQYLAPPIGKLAMACAFVFSTDSVGAIGAIELPQIQQNGMASDQNQWIALAQSAPAAAVIPLLQAIQNKVPISVPLNINSPLWEVKYHL